MIQADIILQDRPLSRKEDDLLDRGPFVESLIRALVRDVRDAAGKVTARRATGYVVGLTGRWGLGKSSVLRLTALHLEKTDHVIVASFNPWLFNGREELLNGFFNVLRDAMGRSTVEHARELRDFLDRYWASIKVAGDAAAATADAHGLFGFVSAVWSKVSGLWPGKSPPRSPQEERRSLEEKLHKVKAAVVVLIDELDRVEDDDVRAVAQLIKAVGDFEGVSYLVAYDPDRVADALGRGEGANRRRSGELYLEKIIQHPIPLRPLFIEDVEALLKGVMASHALSPFEPRSERESELLATLKAQITSPREIKRTIGAYAVLEAAVRGEISPVDVVAYSWILTKTPSLRDAIAVKLDKLVDDPSQSEMLQMIADERRRNGIVDEPSAVLGEPAKGHEPLLKLLFPRLGDGETRDDRAMRISRRRNLVRLLYLGNPPGMVPRSEIDRLWSLDDAGLLEQELRAMRANGRLPGLLDRLDDLLPELSPASDAPFWRAMSRITTRSTDWITGADIDRVTVEDAATSIWRLGARHSDQVTRVKGLVTALIAAGDLALVPWLLRKHMFAHGLTHHGNARYGDVILTADETRALLEKEAPRYRSAVLDGTALRRLPNLESIYVLSNAGRWDADLRTSFTMQLKTPEAIATYAALVVPPGYSTDRNHLNEVFDADVVLSVISGLGNVGTWVSNPWLADCVRRLTLILKGRDPQFDHLGDDEDDNESRDAAL